MFLIPGFYFIILNDLSGMFLPIFRAYQGSFAPSYTGRNLVLNIHLKSKALEGPDFGYPNKI